jgi:hypothetical protein
MIEREPESRERIHGDIGKNWRKVLRILDEILIIVEWRNRSRNCLKVKV